MQYKPSRWWFEFALLYNKIFFVLLSVLLNSDDRAWLLLGSLAVLTTGTLALVAIDKPFRSKADQDEDATMGDKLMLMALASQLINYAVAAVCLQHKEERVEAGLGEMSDGVSMFAAVVGLALVGVQAVGVVYAHCNEKVEEKPTMEAGSREKQLDDDLGAEVEVGSAGAGDEASSKGKGKGSVPIEIFESPLHDGNDGSEGVPGEKEMNEAFLSAMSGLSEQAMSHMRSLDEGDCAACIAGLIAQHDATCT